MLHFCRQRAIDHCQKYYQLESPQCFPAFVLPGHSCPPTPPTPSLAPGVRNQTRSSSQGNTDCTRGQSNRFEEERNPRQHSRGQRLLCQLGAARVGLPRQAKWWQKVENLPHATILSSSSETARPPFSPASTKMLFVTHTTFQTTHTAEVVVAKRLSLPRELSRRRIAVCLYKQISR